MTAILFANDDATNGDTPAPKRGRAANSRTQDAKLDRHHAPSILVPRPAIKRVVISLISDHCKPAALSSTRAVARLPDCEADGRGAATTTAPVIQLAEDSGQGPITPGSM
jgi:hypothetical protein